MTRMNAAIWKAIEVRDEACDLQVCCPCTALEFASSLLPSKAVVARVFARGQLQRDGEALQRTDRLDIGQVLTLTFHRPDASPHVSAGTVDVVFRDRILLAVDKPAGLLVHSDGTTTPSLASFVQSLMAGEGLSAVAQPVQRLDVETTGLVLFSLTEEFQPALDAQVAGHEMHKCYLAMIDGRIPGSEGAWLELDGPIARDRHDARKMRVGHCGKPSRTLVRTLTSRSGRTLLEIELATGRKHQIRVHLAHVGHPIVGDALYGGRRDSSGLMLHAWKERVQHPLTGERLELQTSVPNRFVRVFPELASYQM